jgi:hypothetical protein
MKPVKRGFKMWVLACSVTGYCLAVSLYEGKDGSTGQSLGKRVVNKLIHGYEGFGYCLFLDNFFSNLPMIKRLLQKKYFACSTIRQTNFSLMLNFDQTKISKWDRVTLLRRETLELLSGKTAGRNVCVLQQQCTTFQRRRKFSERKRREKRICVVSYMYKRL